MRPQDVVILLKILISKENWQYRDLSADLLLSISEVSESLNRSHIAGLIDQNKKNVFRQSLMEFIAYGLHYVFPQLPGSLVTGVPTAHAHPYFSEKIKSDINYVWLDNDNGISRGLKIDPLYKNAVLACYKDPVLYKLLAAIDIIRVGRPRELKIALAVLNESILL
jgi:hypothetical protein